MSKNEKKYGPFIAYFQLKFESKTDKFYTLIYNFINFIFCFLNTYHKTILEFQRQAFTT